MAMQGCGDPACCSVAAGSGLVCERPAHEYRAMRRGGPSRGGGMRSSKWTRAVLAGVLVPPLVMVVTGASPAAAQAPGSFSASKLAPGARVVADKAPSSRLAQTDRTLLGRTDATRVQVVIKLDY